MCDVCLLFFYCKKRLEYFDLLNHRTSTFVLQTVSSTDILRKVNNQIQKKWQNFQFHLVHLVPSYSAENWYIGQARQSTAPKWSEWDNSNKNFHFHLKQSSPFSIRLKTGTLVFGVSPPIHSSQIDWNQRQNFACGHHQGHVTTLGECTPPRTGSSHWNVDLLLQISLYEYKRNWK